MSLEGQLLDKKSLRSVTGKTADWHELAKDCVAFANATGGHLLIGIEDGQGEPPIGQRISADLPDTLRRKVAERTANVTALPDVVTAPNGGQYIDLVIPRSVSVASTTDGRYFLRVADQSKPVIGDEVLRLASERAALPWETQTTLQIPRGEIDQAQCARLITAYCLYLGKLDQPSRGSKISDTAQRCQCIGSAKQLCDKTLPDRRRTLCSPPLTRCGGKIGNRTGY